MNQPVFLIIAFILGFVIHPLLPIVVAGILLQRNYINALILSLILFLSIFTAIPGAIGFSVSLGMIAYYLLQNRITRLPAGEQILIAIYSILSVGTYIILSKIHFGTPLVSQCSTDLTSIIVVVLTLIAFSLLFRKPSLLKQHEN